MAEALHLPARHLAGLPVPVSFTLQVAGIPYEITWASAPSSGSNAGIEFNAAEIHAIARGIEAERLWPADFKGMCLAKLHDPAVRITEDIAMGGVFVMHEPAVEPWSLGRVLRWLDAELVGFTVDTGQPLASSSSVAA